MDPWGVELGDFIAFGAAIVALIALFWSFRVASDQRLAQIAAMRLAWEELQDSWMRSVLLWDPSWWYYSDVDMATRAQVEELANLVRSDPTGSSYIENLRSETRHLRRVVRYFAYVADAVHTGKLSPEDAYRIFGPEVARHRAALVWIAGRGFEPPTAMGERANDAWFQINDQIPYTYFHHEQRDVVALVNLISAIAAKRGDLRAHFLLHRAEELRPKVGSRASAAAHIRKEISKVTRGLTPTIRGWRRTSLARNAEWIRFSAITMDPEPFLRRGDWKFLRIARYSRLFARRRFDAHANKLGIHFEDE